MSLDVNDLLRRNRQRFLLIAFGVLLVASLLVFAPKANTADSLFADLLAVERTAVTVAVDGMELEINSRAVNVEGVINELGIFLGQDDIVRPGLDASLENASFIEILRVTTEVITEVKNVEIATDYEDRTDLEIGRQIVLDQGREGIIEQTVEIRYVNGEEFERIVVAETVLQEPKNKVVAMGIKDIVTKDGVTFSFTNFFEDAELTAYAAGFEHTGKNPGDYWYGMTFTGTEVKEGRTVAVDPKVIPLGWWMYIEGYGFRRAEDTGSAVRNKRVDIYFDDNDFVHAFGLKRDVKIWVIGPNDPRQ
ncbi:3D domain-containing protein [Desulfuribacillus alkaliarsenatis]|uniref:G5 domain-containing protein n=1 Tax=Desulfuribacillus alkaliarsenatis TaxID=766136 RepID=A0A1E5FZT0_9FIRM|nr:3D domain-containing protein [Desulfuribacillus alkaliarsenatis]OEF95746.1 hypothetical protein BHF68_11655 [Desulfuribacillus alkaliarsenatis]